jgi:hypothetical protein
LLYLVIHTGLQGDDAFQAKDFDKAIELYTEAITLTASEPNKVIFGNRSVNIDRIAFVSQQRGLSVLLGAPFVTVTGPLLSRKLTVGWRL